MRFRTAHGGGVPSAFSHLPRSTGVALPEKPYEGRRSRHGGTVRDHTVRRVLRRS